MAEAPYQRDWRPIGERHGLRISHATSAPEPGSWLGATHRTRVVTFTVLRDDGSLVLRHEVPYRVAPTWVAALIAVLDVPADELPDADRWGEYADALARHRMDLHALPGAEDDGREDAR